MPTKLKPLQKTEDQSLDMLNKTVHICARALLFIQETEKDLDKSIKLSKCIPEPYSTRKLGIGPEQVYKLLIVHHKDMDKSIKLSKGQRGNCSLILNKGTGPEKGKNWPTSTHET